MEMSIGCLAKRSLWTYDTFFKQYPSETSVDFPHERGKQRREPWPQKIWQSGPNIARLLTADVGAGMSVSFLFISCCVNKYGVVHMPQQLSSGIETNDWMIASPFPRFLHAPCAPPGHPALCHWAEKQGWQPQWNRGEASSVYLQWAIIMHFGSLAYRCM